jgi:hypothetical protein
VPGELLYTDMQWQHAAQYNLPVMAQFTDDPLICEAYQVNNSTGAIAAVTCPYPTALNRYTPLNWAPNSAGLQCIGNSNAQCAADETPLTASVFNAAEQILQSVSKSAALADAARGQALCQSAATVLRATYDQHCHDSDIRESLRGAWISLLIAGILGGLAVPVLYVLHDATAPAATMSIASVYGPGVCWPQRATGQCIPLPHMAHIASLALSTLGSTNCCASGHCSAC